MAIFIIDQFSLNTDLPLDIRYVPDANAATYSGGQLVEIAADISIYKYPGMQVYDTSTESLYYADNNLQWKGVGGELDASLNDLFQAIQDISSLVNIHEASLGNLTIWNISQDASIEDLREWNEAQDASLIALDTSLGNLTIWQEVQDASIEDIQTDISGIEASIAQIEVSLGNLNQWQIEQDISLGNITNWLELHESSLNNLTVWNEIQDASIEALQNANTDIEASLGNLTQWNIIQDASIVALDNVLTIVETSAGNLTVWNEIQDASIEALRDDITNLDASLDLYVLKSGDTMTGPLVVSSGGIVSTDDVSIAGDLRLDGDGVVVGDFAIGGSLTVDGSVYITNTETIDVSANFIYLNTGLAGPPPATLQSGIVVGRGSEEPYVFLFDETNQTFRIGIADETSTGFQDASTQAVATREDNPITNGIAFWNNALNRFDTSAGLTYSGNKLTLDGSLVLDSYAGAQDLTLVVGTDGIVKAVANTADASINDLYDYIDGSLALRDASIDKLFTITDLHEASLGNLTVWNEIQDASIEDLQTDISGIEASLLVINSSLGNLTVWNEAQDASLTNIFNQLTVIDNSIAYLDSSINQLFGENYIKGAINVGDGSAGVFAGVTADGSIQMRELVGVGAATVTENGNVIEIGLDASFGGEVNTASNIGTGEGLSVPKVGQDLPFKSIDTNDPSTVLITSDNSTLYIDLSIGNIPSGDVSVGGITDTSINEDALQTHQILEFNEDGSIWENTNEILWDTSLATTSDDLGGVPAGTDLEGLTLKEILFKILYEYQIPVIDVSGTPAGGIFEKGSTATQFASIDVNYAANNSNFPIAKLNGVDISKTGSGSIFDASFGLVDTSSGVYTDGAGITNWGGTNRTITYQVNITDDQADQPQPAVFDQVSYTFYYPQWWGTVDENTVQGSVNSTLIKTLDASRLAGEVDLDATFDTSSGTFVKYLFAYPDTVISPDNFGTLSIIRDQNGYDVTMSFDTFNVDVSTDQGNIRYRAYLLKNKVDTETFDITFTF